MFVREFNFIQRTDILIIVIRKLTNTYFTNFIHLFIKFNIKAAVADVRFVSFLFLYILRVEITGHTHRQTHHTGSNPDIPRQQRMWNSQHSLCHCPSITGLKKHVNIFTTASQKTWRCVQTCQTLLKRWRQLKHIHGSEHPLAVFDWCHKITILPVNHLPLIRMAHLSQLVLYTFAETLQPDR